MELRSSSSTSTSAWYISAG
uniref:Uncharacterized protein n=1 Tax=Arundo donax TaxID=35708 RepID=A0A0A8ZBU2_ARUDO